MGCDICGLEVVGPARRRSWQGQLPDIHSWHNVRLSAVAGHGLRLDALLCPKCFQKLNADHPREYAAQV